MLGWPYDVVPRSRWAALLLTEATENVASGYKTVSLVLEVASVCADLSMIQPFSVFWNSTPMAALSSQLIVINCDLK